MRAGKPFRQSHSFARQGGFTFAAVLAATALLALATNVVVFYVSQQAQREREADLLDIGQAYMSAIGSYYELSPGNLKRWPKSFEELLEDKRFVTIKRHLRKAYPDPVARSSNWGIVQSEDGGIAGVYSMAEASPLRTGPVELEGTTLPAAQNYADWKFVYKPPQPTSPVKR